MSKRTLSDSEATVLSELRKLRAEIERTEKRLTTLYRARLALFHRGRALDPPVLQRAMSTAVGVSEVAVTQALRKARERAAKQGGA